MTPRERVNCELHKWLTGLSESDGDVIHDELFDNLKGVVTNIVEKLLIEQQEYFASVQRRKSSFD